MNIYVASSWRNERQQDVVAALRAEGHDVYDFKNPRPGDHGFHWSAIDPDWQNWSMDQYRKALRHPVAQGGYDSDFDAMKWADAFVGVMPFGRSASMEMGWAAGEGKQTVLLLADGEPELMVKMFDDICIDMDEVICALRCSGWNDTFAEEIICPRCGRVCQATVRRTVPWYTYIHECEHCEYVIMESEWEVHQESYAAEEES